MIKDKEDLEIWYPEKKNGRTTFSKVEWDPTTSFWAYKEEPQTNYILAPIRINKNEK